MRYLSRINSAVFDIGGAIDQALVEQQQEVVVKDFRESPIFVAFFYWWLKETPTRIISTGQKLARYFFSYFSIPLLFRTLFDYWKKDEIDTTNMALDDRVRVMMMNLVSRFVGATVRSITIAVGLTAIVFTYLVMLIALIGFVLMPVIVVYLIITGVAGLR